MWPALIGAGLGGYEAYKASRGDIGATLLGAGAGALTPAGLRMAGQALGATGLGAMLAGKGAQAATAGARGLTGAAAGLGKEGLESAGRTAAAVGAKGLRGLAGKLATPLGIGGLAAGAGLALGAPQLAGGIAAAATKPIRTLTGGGMSVAANQQMRSGAYPANPVPVMDQYGNVHILGSTPYDIYSPTGTFQSGLAAQQLAVEAQLKAQKTLKPYEAYMAEETKKADLQRQLAYEGIRQNMQTAQNLLLSGVGTAQQMGLQSGQAISNTLGTLYQYR